MLLQCTIVEPNIDMNHLSCEPLIVLTIVALFYFIFFSHCFTEMVCGALTSVKMLTVHLKQLNMICIKFATWSSFNDYWRWICLARANSISLEIIQILHDCPFLWANFHSVCQYTLLYIDRKQWLTFADHN